jgi:hypothetical protein
MSASTKSEARGGMSTQAYAAAVEAHFHSATRRGPEVQSGRLQEALFWPRF